MVLAPSTEDAARAFEGGGFRGYQQLLLEPILL